MKIAFENGSTLDINKNSNNSIRGKRSKQLEQIQKTWQELYDSLSKEDFFNLFIECLDQKTKLENVLQEIESLTRNPREYEPSYYTINHITRKALDNKGENT